MSLIQFKPLSEVGLLPGVPPGTLGGTARFLLAMFVD
jgi:hypothetical protein